MRAATVVLAATLLAGTQAAVVPRSVTETTTAVTETATETPTLEALTTTGAIETTIETTTEASTSTEAIETTTATPTVEATESATETATAEVAPLTWADCEESTVPHSTACVKKWFHAAGCLNRELPAEKAEGWANNEDIAAIESEMAELYANATATGDNEDKATFEACEPLPKRVMQVFDCVGNVLTDTCATCFTPKTFLGMTLPVMNGTCLGECFHNEADKLAEFCPNLSQMVSCHDTLAKTCGKCMKKEGKLLGMHIMDVNDDCFERCYWKNKDDIRAACPLPEPMKQAIDCHEALAEQCDECVDDDHEVDTKCLDGCFTEKSAQNETLKEMCPERLAAGMTTLAELMPTEDELEYFFEQLLSNVELPFNLDLESIFETIGKLMDNAYPGHGHHGNSSKPHHHDDDHEHDHHDDDDDDDDDDMHHAGQNIAQFVQGFLSGDMHNNTELQTAINGLMQQMFGGMGMNMNGMGMHHQTATAAPTETDDDDDEDATETATSTPTETETETDDDDMTETMTATSTPTAMDDDDATELVTPDTENPLLSFFESYISKILNYESEVAASASATATATSAVEATTTETVSATVEATSTETETETSTETESSTETSTPTADDAATTTEAATTTA